MKTKTLLVGLLLSAVALAALPSASAEADVRTPQGPGAYEADLGGQIVIRPWQVCAAQIGGPGSGIGCAWVGYGNCVAAAGVFETGGGALGPVGLVCF